MKSRVALGLVCCILAAVSMGCMRGPLTWQRVTLNEQIAQDDVAFIEEGRTRLMDVADRLGPPDEIQAAGESLIARYHFSDGRYFRADYGWGLRFVLPMAPELVLGGVREATPAACLVRTAAPLRSTPGCPLAEARLPCRPTSGSHR